MPRAQSPTTKARHLRRELSERLRIGEMMANTLWNLARNEAIPQEIRDTCKVTGEAWDGIKWYVQKRGGLDA